MAFHAKRHKRPRHRPAAAGAVAERARDAMAGVWLGRRM